MVIMFIYVLSIMRLPRRRLENGNNSRWMATKPLREEAGNVYIRTSTQRPGVVRERSDSHTHLNLQQTRLFKIKPPVREAQFRLRLNQESSRESGQKCVNDGWGGQLEEDDKTMRVSKKKKKMMCRWVSAGLKIIWFIYFDQLTEKYDKVEGL